jgi:uncharacterized protein (TIGR01777 family)
LAGEIFGLAIVVLAWPRYEELMHIGITGASGFLARQIIQIALSHGHVVTGFSRKPAAPIPGCQPTRPFGPEMDLNGIEAVVHLAGESILGLWTKEKRNRILGSRTEGTRWVVNAIERAVNKPSTLVSASGAGIYGNRGEEVLTESSPTDSSNFLAEVGAVWEVEGSKAEVSGVRYVALRIALVLGKGGGAMQVMEPIFRSGLGGKLGTGKQWMSWIHVADVAGLFLHALENASVRGPLNGASPNPVRNEEFTKIISEILRRPAFFAAPELILRATLRDEASLLLDSQRVIPAKALQTGFRFRFPDLRTALADILT